MINNLCYDIILFLIIDILKNIKIQFKIKKKIINWKRWTICKKI